MTKQAHDHPHRLSAGPILDANIDESMYVWSKVPITSAALNTDVAQMLLLKANYLVDVRCAKNNLIM